MWPQSFWGQKLNLQEKTMTTTQTTTEQTAEKTTFLPQVDVVETLVGYRLVFDIPGVTKKDVKISFEKGKLNITGDISSGIDQGARYERNVRLSDDLDKEKITAKLENGILDLAILKKPEAQPVAISVN